MSALRPYAEEPVVFGRDHSLVGVTCRPVAPPPAPRPFVIFLNAGIIHRSGPNRMTVRLARALARVGVPSLRFDLSGIGDSIVPPSAAAMSIQERVSIDIDDAMAFARAHWGAETFVMGGLCSGADNALRTAARSSDVAGLFLLDLNVCRTSGYYVRHVARRLFDGGTWRNVFTGRHPLVRAMLARAGLRRAVDGSAHDDPALPHDAVVPYDEMRAHLHHLMARDARLLCIFTAGLEAQYNYRRQFLHLFPDVPFGDRLRLRYFTDSDHVFTGSTLQERLTREVVAWVSETAFPASGEPSGRDAPATVRRYSLTPRSLLRRRGTQRVFGSSESGRGR